MNKPSLAKIKAKTKAALPTIITGVAIGATVTAAAYHRMYNPKDQVAMQFPKGVMEKMREDGKTLALNTNAGWFTLKYHPQD